MNPLNGWLTKNSPYFPPAMTYKISGHLITFYLPVEGKGWHMRSVILVGNWIIVRGDLDRALDEIITLSRSRHGNALSFAA